MHRTKTLPTKQARREPKDIVFREADARWVHHPLADTLVIIARVTNSKVHRIMVDDDSAVDILYLNAYKRISLIEDDLDPNNSPLYGFTRDHAVPKGVAKLTITVGEYPGISNVHANFLVVDAPSTINEIIGRLLLKGLKAVTFIYHLTMKFLTVEGTGEVRGNQYNSRECYNK